jgi:hypothetical protein
MIDWVLKDQKEDGSWLLWEPDWDVYACLDAVYFHVGGLVLPRYLQMQKNLMNEEILGWGYAMDPDKIYSCL